jgi:methylenetetrahydrofolate dehydrogenase (NADP+) / methenyltetrahydrofolate cyclohydrolase
MTATILDGKAVAAAVHDEVAARVVELQARGIQPGLATVLVGEDPASHVYVRNKRRTAEKVGITSFHHELDASVSQTDVEGLLDELSADPAVHGILLQLPLPGDLDGEAAVMHIDPSKDADGLHPVNLGNLILDRPGPRPCTPSGCLRILDHYGIETEGQKRGGGGSFVPGGTALGGDARWQGPQRHRDARALAHGLVSRPCVPPRTSSSPQSGVRRW